MSTELLIHVLRSGCCVARVRDGRPELVYVEHGPDPGDVGSIFKGRVVRIEPAIQSAFVLYRANPLGFLHVSDVEPAYYRHLGPAPGETPRLEEILRVGQDILVQVIRKGEGRKGATLSTYLSVASRYAVLMPGLTEVGISRKVSEERREALWKLVNSLDFPKGLGFILRVAADGPGREELQEDVDCLSRVWAGVARRIATAQAPAEVYREEDPVRTVLRDALKSEVETVWVDESDTWKRARDFVEAAMPGRENRVHLYDGAEPLFRKYGITEEGGPWRADAAADGPTSGPPE